jgi:hypothetical protein
MNHDVVCIGLHQKAWKNYESQIEADDKPRRNFMLPGEGLTLQLSHPIVSGHVMAV